MPGGVGVTSPFWSEILVYTGLYRFYTWGKKVFVDPYDTKGNQTLLA